MKEPKSLQNEESSKEGREEIQDGKTPSPSKRRILQRMWIAKGTGEQIKYPKVSDLFRLPTLISMGGWEGDF
jgi:hypothetical protein